VYVCVCGYVHIETYEASPVFVDFGEFAGHEAFESRPCILGSKLGLYVPFELYDVDCLVPVVVHLV